MDNKVKQHNIQVLRAGIFPWSSLLLFGITVPFFLSRGFSMEQIFFSQGVFSITLSLFELPSGYFSDKISRKFTLLIAGVGKGIGGILIIYADNFPLLILAFFFLGIGNSFFSGTDISLLYDMHEENEEKKILHEMANLQVISNIASTFGVISGGLIANYSIEWAVTLNGLVACLPFFIYLFLIEPKKGEPAPNKQTEPLSLKVFTKAIKDDIKICIGELVKSDLRFNLFVALIIALQIPSVVSLYTFQLAFMNHGMSTFTVSLIISISLLFSAYSAKRLPSFVDKYSKRSVILFSLALAGGSYALNGVGTMSASIAGFLLLDILKVIISVYFIKEYNSYFTDDFRSTLNSFLSLVTRLLLAIIAPLWGHLVVANGMEQSSLYLGAIFFVIFFCYLVISTILKSKYSNN